MSYTVIVSAKRTPLGSFNGALSTTPTVKLGATAIKGTVDASGVNPEEIDEVIMGNVLPAGEGQSPARQALIKAGLPIKTPALTINKVCGSGLKAIMLADQVIRAGDANIIVAGGMENMSLAPFSLEKARTGYRMGNGVLEDLMIKDGLWDPYNNCHMGSIAEKCAAEYNITREAQDTFAKESYLRAIAAQKDGKFKDEITPVAVPQRKGEPLIVDTDEEPGKGNVDKLPKLRAAFQKEGTVTAGNASSINDGAATVMVMAEDKAKDLGLKPMVKIIAQAQASQEPEWFTTAPALAMEKALEKAGLKSEDIDLWEVNEAFSVVSIFNNEKLNVPADKVNVNGGAVAIGHPIGASGARIFVTLVHEMMKRSDVKYGLASLCIGGGEAVALIVEKI
jgi:acetyl-CoA C-acetyltransferase